MSMYNLQVCRILKSGNYQQLQSLLIEKNATELNLSGMALEYYDLRVLAKAVQGTKVTTLNLEQNNISKPHLIELSKNLHNTPIEILILNNNPIGADGITTLATVLDKSHITSLHLSNTQLGREGVVNFATVYKGNKLKFLNLENNKIGNNGALMLSILIRNKGITKLNLGFNNIDLRTSRHLIKNLQDLYKIKVILTGNGLSKTDRTKLIEAQTMLLQKHIKDSKTSPIYALRLLLLSDEEKQNFLQLPYPTVENKIEPLRFAGEILACLPIEIAFLVINYLPTMQSNLDYTSPKATVSKYFELINLRDSQFHFNNKQPTASENDVETISSSLEQLQLQDKETAPPAKSSLLKKFFNILR